MISINDEQTLSNLSDIDVGNTTSDSSSQKFATMITSTPQSTYKPRVNFHSIESLASSCTSIFSPSIPNQKNDDTGYSSFNSPTPSSREYYHTFKCNERKTRRKLSDWQIWYLNQIYAKNRYPTPHEQEQIAAQVLLPTSSIRIWFQNHRARSGKK
ncbi:unnamed protein product [Rotaria sordida]|uniref:Homeobox domain-containing protein n=1 Tax=Rotaria sordida TaxID=392033 RepID=A0A819GHP6_9BILA|nr:unnamed protein product [Rotaria sordida]CAF0935677.1 unnamed protein product [Rotaria sordida]CAF0964390.1 unnamed protein product [Rotaria sordida]CAF3849921.1 unnamed protein product [Rotaria sordida]CAF3881987.1 unnamed protein product [Rotaria sordida]